MVVMYVDFMFAFLVTGNIMENTHKICIALCMCVQSYSCYNDCNYVYLNSQINIQTINSFEYISNKRLQL